MHLFELNSFVFVSLCAKQEWILEIMTEFLQSPLWKNPIISFVEENCVYFENTEENRLDYTAVHTKFKRLVESKLEAYI